MKAPALVSRDRWWSVEPAARRNAASSAAVRCGSVVREPTSGTGHDARPMPISSRPEPLSGVTMPRGSSSSRWSESPNRSRFGNAVPGPGRRTKPGPTTNSPIPSGVSSEQASSSATLAGSSVRTRGPSAVSIRIRLGCHRQGGQPEHDVDAGIERHHDSTHVGGAPVDPGSRGEELHEPGAAVVGYHADRVRRRQRLHQRREHPARRRPQVDDNARSHRPPPQVRGEEAGDDAGHGEDVGRPRQGEERVQIVAGEGETLRPRVGGVARRAPRPSPALLR